MAKKTFRDNINPAMQFITAPAEETEQAVASVKAPKGYKLNPLFVETKSKRLQLLIQPSLYGKLKVKAKSEGKSVNDTVNTILQEALREE